MADHPHQLIAVEFTQADQARLVGFSCGEENWAEHVAEWIRGSDVLNSLKRGTRVWRFETQQGEIVGFGSLGTSRWRWPPPEGAATTIVLIPMLGVDRRYQGQPAEPEWRFARQMTSHLIAEARNIVCNWRGLPDEKPSWLVLMVHRDNARAIRFYENCGFQLIPNVERRHGHLVMTMWIGDPMD